MKQTMAVITVIVVVAAIGFAGFWIGRAGAPTAPAAPIKNESAVAPSVPQSTSSVPAPSAVAAAPKQEKAAPKRLQSTYVPQDAASTVHSQETPAKTSSAADPNADMKARIAATFEKLESDEPRFPSPNSAPHQLVLTQAADPDWSSQMDQTIYDRLTADVGSQFDISSVDCRTDICELQIAGLDSSNVSGDMHALPAGNSTIARAKVGLVSWAFNSVRCRSAPLITAARLSSSFS